ncbi:MAG: acetate--CoA ligase family protein [Alphaproteobacteria bacterium]|nr:acetate--CoA ligase family protein [Alphaproteobacteria bacterium]
MSVPSHLDPVLRPRSVALVGASPREGTVGNTFVSQLTLGGFEARNGRRLYLVNPRYTEITGIRCYPSLAALPEPPEHVTFAVPDTAVEDVLAQAIAVGARAGTILSSLQLAADGDPPLAARVQRTCRDAGFLLFGGNGMGFYNFEDGVWMCGFRTRTDHRPGRIAFLSHSGSALCSLVDADARIDYNFVVSPGQELVLTMADFLDVILDQPSTGAVGLFLETARDPAKFDAVLAKAAARRIPIVVVKVGRTETSARLALSHSGAMTGDDDAYQALFDRHGVQRVSSLDELATALMLFQQTPKPLRPGGLCSLHDSGGERELIIDLADRHGVPFARIGEATTARLAARLDPGLAPVNPLDAWGTGNDAQGVYRDCLTAMMEDADTAIGAVVCDRKPGGKFHRRHAELAASVMAATGKPIVVCSNHQGSGDSCDTVEIVRGGVPVLDGVPAFLTGLRAMFAFRDFAPPGPAPLVDTMTIAKWRRRLTADGTLDEDTALELVAEFEIQAVARRLVTTRDEAVAAAAQLGLPVALKTASPGVLHKTEAGGVRLGLATVDAVASAYDDLAARLGPRVLVARMAEPGVEMILGVRRDAQLGPTIVIGTGGIHAELLHDVIAARPPFDAGWALKLIDRLKLRRLLDGVRGRPACDVAAFAEATARLSGLSVALADRIREFDLNPVIVHAKGCIAVDAMAVVG